MTADLFASLRDARHNLACQLEPLDPPAREIMVRSAVIVSGGCWIEPPPPSSHWGPHFFELSLFGVSQTGDCPEEAIRLWMDAVRRSEAAFTEASPPAA